MWFSVMYTAQGCCTLNIPCPHSKWCGLCVTEKQATDAARCGPGVGVRPHDWMDSCAVFISQKCLLLSALTSHSAPLWPYGHAQLLYMHKEKRVCAWHCTYIARNVFMARLSVTLCCCYIGSWTFSCLCIHGMGCVMQAVLFACRGKDTCLSS